MTAIAIATRNAQKVREIREILGGGFRCLSLDDFPGAPAAKEDASTFEGNAIKKACGLAEWIDRNPAPVLEPFARARGLVCVVADDSGLEVDALGGAPGVHSARYAATDGAGESNAPDEANNSKLLAKLQEAPLEKRAARFRCALALAHVRLGNAAASEFDVAVEPMVFEGVCEGHIAFAPAGAGGFGYDPLFIPNGYAGSFAQLGQDIKNSISHRSIALRKLTDFLKQK